MRPLILLFVLLSLGAFRISAQCDLIYVSPTGSGNTGSIDAPTTIAGALSIFANDPNRNVIYLLQGQYLLAQKLQLPSGITIEGGFTTGVEGWIKNSSSISQILINPQAEYDQGLVFFKGIELSNVSDVHLEDITISVLPAGTNLTFNRAGASIYGVYANNAQDYRLERCIISTGAAASGVNGLQGANGASGSVGAPGIGGCSGCGGFGQGGAGGGGANNGGNGGNGGYGNNNGLNGAQGAGPSGGSGGTGGSGDGSTCAFGCNSGGTGSPGQVGGPGQAGNNGASTPNGSIFNSYFFPGNGVNANNGTAGSGGGGGGGGGGTDCCLDDRGGGGGGGGAGGAGGAGGESGGGGGASIAFFAWNNGASSELIDLVLNPGSAGFGAIGANGGTGGAGGSGGTAGPGADDAGPGGAGGAGGQGGAGGSGGNGANGLSQQNFVNGNSPSIIETSWPAVSNYQASYNYGCSNSVIGVTRTSGNWDLNAMGAAFVNDVSANETSYLTSDAFVQVYFNAIGDYSIATTSDNIQNFIEIRELRALPVISAIPDSICSAELIDLSTVNAGDQWKWSIINGLGQQVQQLQVQNPTNIQLADGNTYFIKLEIFDECCGWSIPVFDSLYVRPFSNLMESASICEGESILLGGVEQTVAGVYTSDTVDEFGCEAQSLTCLFVQDCTEGGCTDPLAINYDPLVINDDGSCVYGDGSLYCGPGTYWDEIQQLCVPFCREDLNNDGLVNTADLLQLLAMFGVPCP